MQVTINLEQELLEAAQKMAKSRKTTLDTAMSQLLRLGLAVETDAKGQPRFTLALPGGTVTSDDVRAALEDEDE
jgi:hypothetical protein